MFPSLARREMMFGGLLTVFYGTCGHCPALAQDDKGSGCHIPSDQFPDYVSRIVRVGSSYAAQEEISPRSGNAALDRALVRSLARLTRMFDVLPGFAYYREAGRPNAQATTEVLLQRTDGTVLFGLGLLQMLLQRPSHPDASIVAVCAHEYGHIVSYKNGLIRRLDPTGTQPFRAEQYADYIAGFFAGARKLERPDYPAVVFATTQRSFGGGSHGTGVQRGEAVQQGFLDAYQRRLSARQGIQRGYEFAMGRP